MVFFQVLLSNLTDVQIREKLPLTLEQLQKLQQFGGAASLGSAAMSQRGQVEAPTPAAQNATGGGFPDRSAPGGLSGALGDLSQPEQAELQSKVSFSSLDPLCQFYIVVCLSCLGSL